jgi:hypothetical protein
MFRDEMFSFELIFLISILFEISLSPDYAEIFKQICNVRFLPHLQDIAFMPTLTENQVPRACYFELHFGVGFFTFLYCVFLSVFFLLKTIKWNHGGGFNF